MDSYTRAAINVSRCGNAAPAGRLESLAIWSAMMAFGLFILPTRPLLWSLF
ncbi:hypothetical protein [Paracoccus sp. (in: a-proteobacteria)]|uniref:hypothetical protein n=1 Tax=Paracoccus sp. TaxID=267 RepID=UPI003A86DA70